MGRCDQTAAQCGMLRLIRCAVALLFGGIVESGIGILPGACAHLAPFGGADDPEIFHVGGAVLGFKVDIEQRSADTEEHPVLIDGVQIEIGILEIRFIAQGGDAMDGIVGCIRNIQADAAADALQNDPVLTDLIFVLSLETI